ncbi:MAG: hypothetical protein KGJ96_14450 [Xanthomonadaceae bacterium]|nr:hypothetical protein [Xanthomonadaceae bacterium]
MKSLIIPVVFVAVVLFACVGIAGGGMGWMRGWYGGQSMMGMHRGMQGMMAPATASVPADAPAAFRQYACASCHALRDRGVGPALAWVAWRHRGQPGAQQAVAAFIARGGRGPWGGVMPNLAVPSAQADALARWILALPPEPPPEPRQPR